MTVCGGELKLVLKSKVEEASYLSELVLDAWWLLVARSESGDIDDTVLDVLLALVEDSENIFELGTALAPTLPLLLFIPLLLTLE